jgi:hypothetical protein
MGFGFLGADGGNNAAIRDGSIGRDLVASDEVDCFGPRWHALADAVGKAA